jgi:hypothetical protein
MISKARFFIGACILTAALLLPHAPVYDILMGFGLAALLLFALEQK